MPISGPAAAPPGLHLAVAGGLRHGRTCLGGKAPGPAASPLSHKASADPTAPGFCRGRIRTRQAAPHRPRRAECAPGRRKPPAISRAGVRAWPAGFIPSGAFWNRNAPAIARTSFIIVAAPVHIGRTSGQGPQDPQWHGTPVAARGIALVANRYAPGGIVMPPRRPHRLALHLFSRRRAGPTPREQAAHRSSRLHDQAHADRCHPRGRNPRGGAGR